MTTRARGAAGPGSVLRRTLADLVEDGELTGAAVAVIDGGDVDVVCVGTTGLDGGLAVDASTPFALASVTKPLISVLAAMLVEGGVLVPNDPIDRWVPELGSPRVLAPGASSVDDVVAPTGPVLVRHLLDSTCGYGFPADLSGTGVAELLEAVGDGRRPHELPDAATWLARLARVPLLRQPGERWLYETSHDLLGEVLARAAGRPLAALLDERLLEPLGMRGTGFAVSAEDRSRVAVPVRWDGGALGRAEADDPAALPRFQSGAGGLISCLDDLIRFARMLLGGGMLSGVRVLDEASVDAITTDGLTAAQRSEGGFFLAGQGWGRGGSVDIDPREPWQQAGRYGWMGVSGTSFYLHRGHGTAVICLTSRELWTADDTGVLERIWAAAGRPAA